MIFSQTKLIWGFVEKENVRVENYRVFIRQNNLEISALTNTNGFYQLNLGNLQAGFNNNDTIFVEATGDQNFYGETSVVVTGGTATQQAATIQVNTDTTSPTFFLFPSTYVNSAHPVVSLNVIDLESGPDLTSLNISYNGSPIISFGEVVNSHYEVSFHFQTIKKLIISIKNKNPLNDGLLAVVNGNIADKVGNPVSFTTTFRVDLLPPKTISFVPIANSFVHDVRQNITVELQDSGSGINPDSITMTVDEMTYTLQSSNLFFDADIVRYIPADPYPNTSVISWRLEAADKAGNDLPLLTSCFAVMANRPQITNIQPQAYTNQTKPTISFDLIEGSTPINLSSFILTVGTEFIYPGDPRLSLAANKGSFEPTVDLTGTVHVFIKVQDEMGLETAVSSSFLIDTTAPVISSVITNGFVRGRRTVLYFSLTDAGSGIDPDSISVLVNGFPSSFNFGGATLAVVPSEPYFSQELNTVNIEVSDLASNAAVPLVFQFLVDEEAPIIESVYPVPGSKINKLQPEIVIGVKDQSSGVDPASIAVNVNGAIFKEGVEGYSFDGLRIRISQLNFNVSEVVIVRLSISDNLGNHIDIAATSFGFDVTPPMVIETEPSFEAFVPLRTSPWRIKFDKPILTPDLNKITVKTKNATDPSAFFIKVDIDPSSGMDSLDDQTLLVSIVGGFEHNKIYQLNLNDAIESLSGNYLGPFETVFTVYQPGDTLLRNQIGVADLYKYAKIFFNSDFDIVSPLPELVDLTGAETIDTQDLLLLQSIILKEKTIKDIVVGNSIKITNLPIPNSDGNIPTLNLSGFPSAPIAGNTEGTISIPGATNVAGFQIDLFYDQKILLPVDLIPLVSVHIFRYREINPGCIRILMVDLEGLLSGDLINVKFSTIGAPQSNIQIGNFELIGLGERFIEPNNIIQSIFTTDLTKQRVVKIKVDIEHSLVPSSVRETVVTATLQDINNIDVPVEGIPVEWKIIGNGFSHHTFGLTNASGKLKTTVHFSGPVNSSIQVSATMRYDASVSGMSAPIMLFDSRAIGLSIQPDAISAGTGQPIQLLVFAQTHSGKEFQTTDVTWIYDDRNIVVSSNGEFVAFEKGEYRVKAQLNSDPSISTVSPVITVTSVIEFFDCDSNALTIDSMTGFSKLSLGNLFAGHQTGTQEIVAKNTMNSSIFPMDADILLDTNIDNLTPSLTTQFSPLLKNSCSLIKRSATGNMQIISLTDGFADQVLPCLKTDDSDSNGVIVIYLDYVNVSDVGVFNCGLNSCIGRTSRNAFQTAQDSIAALQNDGDFFIDNELGRIYVKITLDANSPGRITYKYNKSVSVIDETGAVTLSDVNVLASGDLVLASYKFKTGKLENVLITVQDGVDTDILISPNGVLFEKSITLDVILPGEMAKFYVRANTLTDDPSGLQFGQLVVEANIVSAGNCI